MVVKSRTKSRTIKKTSKSKQNRRYKNKKQRLTKRNRKSLSKNKKYKQKQQRQQRQQKGGFVKPFIPEFKNLVRGIPVGISEHYHKINPEPYPAPGNPDKVDIDPHPAYDQYLRNTSKMIDPEQVLGPNLKRDFNESIKVNSKM
tara:strand:+ start:2993 stop:3424 length:432 start_codon:yes stop_codon:yes gene_type:complete